MPTRDDIFEAFRRTLAYQTDPVPLDEVRPFEQDMMEDLPAYKKVVDAGGSIHTADYALSPEGVRVAVASGPKRYDVVVGITDVTCNCPAASRWHRGDICKHQACAIHDLLFGERIEREVRWRAIYNCGHVFGPTLDLATRLNLALEILDGWGLIERVAAGWRATPVGAVASLSRLDLLLVRQATQRVGGAKSVSYDDVALWAVEDYFAEEKARKAWTRAAGQWVDEVDTKKIRLPTKYRGDFERGLEDLSNVCRLYRDAARALGKPELADAAEAAGRSLRYGVAPEVVPLAALGFPQLGRARCRHLYECGIRNVQDLANAAPGDIADPRRAPQKYVREWIHLAKEIHQARAVARADREEADTEFDELVARFQLDPAALAA